MSHAARSDSVATVTADKNDIAKLLGLREVGVPRISHDSGAKMIHSKLFFDECLLTVTRCSLLVALSPSLMRGERCRGGARGSCYKCSMRAC